MLKYTHQALARYLLLFLSVRISLAGRVPISPGTYRPRYPRISSRASTCNTATDRACWTANSSITTDYENFTPVTGVTRSYTFTLTEVDNWAGGDGVPKVKAMLVNGQTPGPTIEADWGDRIDVTIENQLVTNGTSIHFHGVRQLNSNNNDGSNGITECPIPPGGCKTYSFLATQYGTGWYHSHFSMQYGYGVLGPIVINGPASANYDIDLGAFPISDWYYSGIDDDLLRVEDPNNPFVPGFPGAPPTSDNVLFNGTNINPKGAGGSYAKIILQPGKLHRLRLINPSVENTFSVSLVGHSFTVISTDFVPVQPTTVSSVYMTVGQRYDVLINASQPVDNYWLNVTMQSAQVCGTTNNPAPAAIVSYAGAASNSTPTDPGTKPAAADASCADELSWTPVVTRTAPVASFTPNAGDTFNAKIQVDESIAKVFWPVNDTPMNVSWGKPTLNYVSEGTVPSIPSEANVVAVPQENIATFWLIQNNSSIPHPIHLHGHDILILGASPPLASPLNTSTLRAYDPATDGATLKGNNPTRRDTTVLPAWGWLVVAFETNNPGAWLFHCHTAWHVSQGFSVQFLEQLDAIPQSMDLSTLTSTCDSWNAYFPANDPYPQDGSGL